MRPVATRQEEMNSYLQNQARVNALGVQRLGLFGSFVREQQASESDIQPSPFDYLRHVLDEVEYLMHQARDLGRDEFRGNETLK